MSRETPKILQIQVYCIITQLTSYYALWQYRVRSKPSWLWLNVDVGDLIDFILWLHMSILTGGAKIHMTGEVTDWFHECWDDVEWSVPDGTVSKRQPRRTLIKQQQSHVRYSLMARHTFSKLSLFFIDNVKAITHNGSTLKYLHVFVCVCSHVMEHYHSSQGASHSVSKAMKCSQTLFYMAHF